MAFVRVPSLFRIPKIPFFEPPAAIWRGTGRDDGRFAFDAGSAWGGHVIVEEPDFCPSLKIGRTVMKPVFSDINGYIHWGNDPYAYYSRTYGWVVAYWFPGCEPEENTYFDENRDRHWSGDDFYTFSDFPSEPGATAELEPRGGSIDYPSYYLEGEISVVWPRWVAKDGQFGVYEGTDGASGTRVFGLPRFRSGDGETFVRSFAKKNGYYTYGRIRRTDGRWLIGEYGSEAGWHEGSEPSVGGSVRFAFRKPQGSQAEGTDITVSFLDRVMGDEKATAYLGSVAIWR